MQNWKSVGPVTLWDTINQTGVTYADLNTFVTNALGRTEDRLGDDSLLDKFAKGDAKWGGFYRYLLRDENGLTIPLWKIEEAASHTGVYRYWRERFTWNWKPLWDYEYRCDPVPNIHCFRGGNSYFRSIKTFGERRENTFCNKSDEDARFYGVRARARRCGHNLPEPWDDIGRSDWGHRSWKRHRKTQYRTRK